MVSVSSITEQLCKQKLQDDWSNTEPEKRSVLSCPDCLVSAIDNCGVKAKSSKSLKFDKDSRPNNNVLVSNKKENETVVSSYVERYSGQMEQMPPKKKHRRSFSIPGEAKHKTGSGGFRRIQHSPSSLGAAILHPFAVRPCTVMGSFAASRDNKAAAAAHLACRNMPELNSNFDNSFSISGPCSGFYDKPAANFAAANSLKNEPCKLSVGFAEEKKLDSKTTFRFTMSHASDVWCSLDGSTSASNDLLSSSDQLSVRSRSVSSAPSNSDLGDLCQGSIVTNPYQHQTPERKTGLKRRHDEDRPKLDFFKMIETAYEKELFSCSISPQMGNKCCSKDDVSLSLAGRTQNVDSSTPCLQLDSSDASRTSPASPFISLHHHFLAEKVEPGETDDGDITCFNNRNTAVSYRDQSQKDWRSGTGDDRSPQVDHAIKGDRVAGSEFDLDLIENN